MAAPQQGQSDNSSALFWIIGAIFVFGAAIWFAYKNQIISFYFMLRIWEINLISYFTHGLDDVRTVMLTTPVDQFTFRDVVQLGEAVGSYLAIPFALLIFVLAFVVFFSNKTRVYKRTYSMRDLVEEERINWPQINPVAKLDLIKTNIDKGPWAMAMTPMQFCKKLKLLEERKRQAQEGMTKKELSQVDVVLKRGLANKIFAIQLGPVWQGVDKLPPHTKALFGTFAARYNGDADAARRLFDQMNISSTGKLDFSGADELCKKYGNTKGIQRVVNSHAYVLTVMAGMLEAAREDGVQASSDFLWLKPVDRRLWYMLNTIGRQTAFVEVAGPIAHWKAEKQIGRKLLIPMVEEATNALELALKEVVYKPDEE